MKLTVSPNKKFSKRGAFKLKIEQWRCLEWLCTLSKTHLPNLGYLEV